MGPTTRATPSRRHAGILLHLTSLPGQFGIGDLGPQAMPGSRRLPPRSSRGGRCCRWVRPATATRPTSASPPSPAIRYLISPELLVARRADPARRPGDWHQFPDDRVDYGARHRVQVAPARHERGTASRPVTGNCSCAFDDFCRRARAWLDDFALFMAIKDAHGRRSWQEWPEALRRREAGRARAGTARSGGFDRAAPVSAVPVLPPVGAAARPRGSQRGDSLHWRYADLRRRRLRRRVGEPATCSCSTRIAGRRSWPACRPITSPRPASCGATRCTTGRRIETQATAWWAARLRATLAPGRPGAPRPLPRLRGGLARAGRRAHGQNGRWVPGPGAELFRVAIRPKPGPPLQGRWEALPLIAEDLGVITPEVDELRQELGLPGMRDPAVRLRRGDGGPLPAAQLRAQHRRLHRHARQRHHGWLV